MTHLPGDRHLPTEERILREAPRPQTNLRAVFTHDRRPPIILTSRGRLLFEVFGCMAALVFLTFAIMLWAA